MAQKSALFTLYRNVGVGGAKALEYYPQVMFRETTDPNEATADLGKAALLDKQTAFKYALGEKSQGREWSVGEIVSTKNGVHIEE